MSGEPDFHGAKVAVFIDDQILVYRRDNKPDIPFPDMLDLPGGGRENGESGAECVARETYEEFGISIAIDAFKHVQTYPNWRGTGHVALFFVCRLARHMVDDIVFGDEGQDWQLMPVAEFLASDRAVPHLQYQLQEYLKIWS
ncbi:MAG: NUDIX domain-containing protein [Sphingomonadales bacterium]|nr:NUDIX domain-containing protein [Sphingomonadales bacterium]NCO50115.1 NUDIX domain-containing protein [Sphingomonadales bacterium]NCO99550.1 NUDIX domain-containing protein [Sphingomonadales bacterium]NCP27678.1 NUDIX domain-containing protein [Sphingomonadales bacterium]NCP43490.1 NUDIX domain-containing protein [Sphingomonadales bacterium]